MILDTPLTEKELAAPHKAVLENRLSMSVLERSFYLQRIEQINQWDDLGVLEAAMSGNVPRVRRKYSQTLLDFFLKRGSGWWSYEQLAPQRTEVLHRLWSLGAQKHPECFDAWLVQSLGDGFSDTLLAAGANPHANLIHAGYTKNATAELILAIHQLENMEKPSVSNAFMSVLRSRFDRFLQTPGASQSNLDRYLGDVVRFSKWGKHPNANWWRATMEKLLNMGARPAFGFEGALSSLPSFHPSSRGVLWWSGRLQQEASRTGRELDEESRKEFLGRLHWREMMQSARNAHTALDVLLPYRESWDTSDRECRSEIHWERLLQKPGGLGIARKLLAAGVPAPWRRSIGTADSTRTSSPSLLANYSSRDWRRLRRFATLVSPGSVSPQWAQQSRERYLSQTCLSDGGRQEQKPHSPAEIDTLLRVLPPQTLQSHELVDWITRLPELWLRHGTSAQEQQEMVRVLTPCGLLQDLLPLSAFPRTKETVSLVRQWVKAPGSQAIWSADPTLATGWKVQVAATYAQQDNIEKIAESVKEAAIAHPPVAESFIELAWDRFNQRRDIASCISLWATVQGLRDAGWVNSDPARETIWATAVLARVSEAWPELHQASLIRQIKAAAVDFDTCMLPALEDLLAREASLSTRPTELAKILPLVVAIIEEGLDLTRLPSVVDPTRPLGCAVSVAREQILLQESTAPAMHSPRSRRL